MMSLGETIRILRTEQQRSQSDLAEALGVSRQSVSKWETDGAVPELEKLVAMSALFGVTLDALVKGAPAQEPTSPPAQETPAPPHRTAGIILLCFGGLIALFFYFMGGGLGGLLFAAPFFLCGAICLYSRRRAGLWCGWAIVFCVDLYLRYATGVTWKMIFLTPHFTPEMNYMRLAVGWGMFVAELLILGFTLWAFRAKTMPWDRRHILPVLAGWAAVAALAAGQTIGVRCLLRTEYTQVRDLWIRLLGDSTHCLGLVLLAAALVGSAALLRQRWRSRRAARTV